MEVSAEAIFFYDCPVVEPAISNKERVGFGGILDGLEGDRKDPWKGEAEAVEPVRTRLPAEGEGPAGVLKNKKAPAKQGPIL